MSNQTFTDGSGRVWALRLDWAAMRRAKAAGVDLSKIEEITPDLFRCGVELIESVWACLDLSRGPVNRDEFEAALTGEVMPAARDALFAAVMDFFPESRRAYIAAARAQVEHEFAELRRQLALQGSNAPSTA